MPESSPFGIPGKAQKKPEEKSLKEKEKPTEAKKLPSLFEESAKETSTTPERFTQKKQTKSKEAIEREKTK